MSGPSGWTAPGGPVPPEGPGGGGWPAAPGVQQPGVQQPGVQPSQPAGGWGAPPGWGGAGPLAPRPGIVPLRPLSLGELYDGAFQAVRTNPGAVLGFSAVVVVVLTVVQTLVQVLTFGSALDTVAEDLAAGSEVALQDFAGELGGFLVGSLLTQALTLVATALLAGVVTVAVSTAVLGRRTGSAALWERVRPRLLALVGLALLLTLIAVAAFVVCLLPGLALVLAGAGTGGTGLLGTGVVVLLLGVLASLAAYLAVDARLFLATPALVLEGLGVGAALSRAWRLSRVGFWRLLGVRLLAVVVVAVGTALVAGVLGGGLSLVVSLFAQPQSGSGIALVSLVPSAIGSAVALTIFYPLSAAVTALQYVDQRMRREGLDVELARAAGAPGSPGAPA